MISANLMILVVLIYFFRNDLNFILSCSAARCPHVPNIYPISNP